MGPRFKGRLRKGERAVGVLSVLAGLVHGGLAPEHFAQWWGYGLFFLFAGAAQVLFGLAVGLQAINLKDTGPHWLAWRRRLYLAGILGNLAVMLLYDVTRTVGIPWFGPAAGTIEQVAPIDVVSKLLEATLVLLLYWLWRRAHDGVGRQV